MYNILGSIALAYLAGSGTVTNSSVVGRGLFRATSGGMMTPAAFSKTADVPAGRLDGLIARIQRLLNVDGYEILIMSRTENRIELNVSKLKRQFDLE